MKKKKYLDIDVLTAAKQRYIEAFAIDGIKFTLAFSGGKDSIVLSDILFKLCESGKVDKNKIEAVEFVDEEAMFDDVIKIVELWRRKWMGIGVKFNWYCMEYKHYNCLNSLSEEETFICWDRRKKDVWVRQMPKFAIKSDPYFIPMKDNYQSWQARRRTALKLYSIQGLRCSESLQRYQAVASRKSDFEKNAFYPIYDFTDADIWLYIRKYNCEYPKTYEQMYRTGTSLNRMRISQFFSVDTAKCLVSMNEYCPDLMERVTKREPNAYLCAMYWDTEMFGKSTAKRKKMEQDDEAEKKDYKKLLFSLIKNIDSLDNDIQKETAYRIKKYILKYPFDWPEKSYRRAYECILIGDPKARATRALSTDLRIAMCKENEK